MSSSELQFISNQEWPGIHSKRFNHNERIHLHAQDQLIDFQGGPTYLGLGRKHYASSAGKPYSWKPQLKVDISRPPEGNTVEFPNGKILNCYEKGKKLIEFHPKQKPPRAERLHLQEGKSGHLEEIPYGIKTYQQSINQVKRHDIEDMMGKKYRIDTLEQTRNNLPLASLGDKSYKFPDYAKDYFKEGGLVPGANITTKKVNLNQLQEKEMERKLKAASDKLKRGTKWIDKVKKDFRKEDEDAVDELDKWIETTLKEANPNYKDPDLFFENQAKQEQPKGKDSKKPGKK